MANRYKALVTWPNVSKAIPALRSSRPIQTIASSAKSRNSVLEFARKKACSIPNVPDLPAWGDRRRRGRRRSRDPDLDLHFALVIREDVVVNAEIELSRFRRGKIHSR